MEPEIKKTKTYESISNSNNSQLDLLSMDVFLDVCETNEEFTQSGNGRAEIPDILELSVTNISGPSENGALHLTLIKLTLIKFLINQSYPIVNYLVFL